MTDRNVCVITGAGSGLGQATAFEMDAAGYQCVLVGRRLASLKDTASRKKFKNEPLLIAADITEPVERNHVVSESLQEFGSVDVLVNNAGISDQQPILDYTVESWDRIMATNVDAMFFLSQAVLPNMIKNHFGRIINIGSVYGSLALNSSLYPGIFQGQDEENPRRQPAYHTSKGAVLNLTRDLAAAVGRLGVTVNSISPGMFLTEQSKAIISQEVINSLSSMTPIGRFGNPLEIGYAVTFLASDRASFITGAEIVIDGGWSIW
jgi:NAD(P)-dependent dehydrogenase (short-subunit alcohol dehydrogenase family)